MQLDSYRWQDHVLSPRRRGIDLALTGFFALALSLNAVMQLVGDRQPAPAADGPAAQAQTAMGRMPPGATQTATTPGCGA